MTKEISIIIVIIVVIIFGNQITQKYTKIAIEETITQLNEIKDSLKEDENQIDKPEMKEKMEQFYKGWEKKHNKLAYFTEHDELEKVKTSVVSLKSYVETNEYEEAMSEINKSIFILQHIKDKSEFNLQNVF